MNQHQFERAYQSRWEEFGILLEQLEEKSFKAKKEISPAELPERYRQLCNHYGLAKSRHFSPALVDKLHGLVSRGYKQLYKEKTNFLWQFILFVVRDFPRTLRKYQRTFWFALLLFYLPAICFGLATYQESSLIYSVMPESSVFEMESMYDGTRHGQELSEGRSAEADFSMFGFYILNNISIGFRTFAGGILLGVGSLFFLLYNGLILGGVAGHLSHPPYSENFWQFVLGHGAFELTAIVICGTAGLLLGYAIVRPGNFTRSHALKTIAPDALKLVMGGAVLLVIAAFIEAFWSSSSVNPEVKYGVAAINWVLVILYLLLAGRGGRGSR